MSWAHTQKMIAAEWTEARVGKLVDLWTAGLSASQCASALGDGVTRNAVIGKIHRLKLPKRKPVSISWSPAAREQSRQRSEARKARPRVKAARQRVSLPKPPKMPAFELDMAALSLPAWEALEGTTPISLVNATDETCRWPIGDPIAAGFGFCGCQTVTGSPYCAHHKARGTHKPVKQKKDIHRVIPAFHTTHSFGLKSAIREEIRAL